MQSCFLILETGQAILPNGKIACAVFIKLSFFFNIFLKSSDFILQITIKIKTNKINVNKTFSYSIHYKLKIINWRNSKLTSWKVKVSGK